MEDSLTCEMDNAGEVVMSSLKGNEGIHEHFSICTHEKSCKLVKTGLSIDLLVPDIYVL